MRINSYDDEDEDYEDDEPRKPKANGEAPLPVFFPEQVQAFANMFTPASPFEEDATCLYPHNLRETFQCYPDYATGADAYPEYINQLKARGFTFSLSPDTEPCIWVKPNFADYEEV